MISIKLFNCFFLVFNFASIFEDGVLKLCTVLRKMIDRNLNLNGVVLKT